MAAEVDDLTGGFQGNRGRAGDRLEAPAGGDVGMPAQDLGGFPVRCAYIRDACMQQCAA